MLCGNVEWQAYSRVSCPRARNGQAKGTQPSENLKSKIAAAPLAQLAEQLTLNQRVAGSIPARCTIVELLPL